MERKLLLERLVELKERYGTWSSIAETANMYPFQISNLLKDLRTEGSTVSLRSIMGIGETQGLAPVALYRQDGEIEDLGVEDFLNGQTVDNYIGRALWKHRKLKGYTQESLAESLGYSWMGIHRYESKHVIPDLERFETISKELNLTPVYLADFPLDKKIQSSFLRQITREEKLENREATLERQITREATLENREAILGRLDDLRGEYGTLDGIAKRANIRPPHLSRLKRYLRTEGSQIYLERIIAIGNAHNLAPIVLYKGDGKIEDLGVEDFQNGQTIDNYIGKVIRKHRKLNGYSQEFLAEMTDYSSLSIIRYEGGNRIPVLDRFETISRELDLTPVYLVKFPLAKNIQQIDNVNISKVLFPDAQINDPIFDGLILR